MAEELPTTSLWLLLRLGNPERPDNEAWNEFVRRYGDPILRWCRQGGLSEADAEDAAQGVLVRLLKAMQTFVYDPTKGNFRGYLRQTTQFAIGDVQRSRGRTPLPVSDSRLDERVAESPGPDASLLELEDRLQWDVAMRLAKEASATEDWEAFEMRLNGVSRNEVAQRMGKCPGWVTKACTRVRAA